MKKVLVVLVLANAVILSACQWQGFGKQDANETKIPVSSEVKDNEESSISNGDKIARILGSTTWQGTQVYDKNHHDLTKENANFIGLAKYDDEASRYEFYDKISKESRGDYGTFFITNDGKFRVLISESKGTQGVVELTEVTEKKYTYKRIGKDANGNDVEVFVEHVPYTESKLAFSKTEKTLDTPTGEVDKQVDGDQILGSTLWEGTIALDENGNDVSEYNANFLGLAKYDLGTSRYEFFDKKTGQSRGDYGYYNVLNDNKIRAHISQGENKYSAVLEVTELNKNKFTYKRVGKNQDGNDIIITVEHVPYNGQLKPDFTQ